MLSSCRGSAFSPRITRHAITGDTSVTLIEPPCGSNTAILESAGETLFIDCGYALYRSEMERIFRTLLPEWDTMRRRIFITHADVDHCGLLPLFDEQRAGNRMELERRFLLPPAREVNGFEADHVRRGEDTVSSSTGPPIARPSYP